MTWSHYRNFGTALQVTALSSGIKKLGYSVDVIDYVPHGQLVTMSNLNRLSGYIDLLRKKRRTGKEVPFIDPAKEKAFEEFLGKYICYTKECKTDSDLFLLNEEYDAFVCGSDQIWAPTFFNEKYFLSFVENPNKRIAYAPSIGLTKIDDPYVKMRMAEHLKGFVSLSVREEQGAEIIKRISGKKAQVVLDPTLLLTSEEWDKLASPSLGMIDEDKPYILCYFLGTDKSNRSHALEMSKKIGLPLKVIPVFQSDVQWGQEVLPGIGPAEFLTLIKNAALVCTDSFHGTCISILYQKPFLTYERFKSKDANNQNSRIHHILRLLGLDYRLVKDTNVPYNNPFECDYSDCNKRLEEKRTESVAFLSNAIKNAINTCKESKYDYVITNTCCGCGVCSLVCPKDAIDIRRDKLGFLKFFIDAEKCVRCKKCRTVCPFGNDITQKIDRDKHSLYMLKSTCKNVLATSSSGGAGFEIARYLSEKGYDVAGCVYDRSKNEAVHRLIKAFDTDSLEQLKGSKYLQSNTKVAFSQVMDQTQRAVVFGTPCQIAGLDLLLKSKNKREQYVLIDLICYGVPSRYLWEKYLKEGSKRYGYGFNPDVRFRDKSEGWSKKYMKIEGQGKTYRKEEKNDLFYRFFHLRNCCMESCYECKFRIASSADIRIGDYWGPGYRKDKEGVSMVIALTEAGDAILHKLKTENRVVPEEKECSDYWTVQYPYNPIKPVFYEELIEDLKSDTKSLDDLASLYCSGFELYEKLYNLYNRVRSVIRNR
jgi:coenzyme F420-reducing hydrogenase beta subunit